MSFATELTKRLAHTNAANRASLSAAFTAFQTAVASEMTTYGSPAIEKAALDSAVIDIAAEVADQMVGETTDVADTLLTEAEARLVTEASAILIQE